jgi:hypothetical protein
MIDAFVPPQRMRAVIFSAQPSAGHPFVDQPGVLLGAEMLRAVVPARESIVVERAATMLKPRLDAGSRRLKQFELHGPAGLLLHHRRPRPDPAAADEIANTDFDDVAAAQLAVDGKVEQGPVTQPSLTVQPEADRPHLLRLQRPLGTDHASGIPRAPLSGRRVEC